MALCGLSSIEISRACRSAAPLAVPAQQSPKPKTAEGPPHAPPPLPNTLTQAAIDMPPLPGLSELEEASPRSKKFSPSALPPAEKSAAKPIPPSSEFASTRVVWPLDTAVCPFPDESNASPPAASSNVHQPTNPASIGVALNPSNETHMLIISRNVANVRNIEYSFPLKVN